MIVYYGYSAIVRFSNVFVVSNDNATHVISAFVTAAHKSPRDFDVSVFSGDSSLAFRQLG